jgi:single-strand DNA-binding protein
MNSIILMGRTTSDIELKQTQGGKSVSSFSLAVKRPYTKDITDFINVVAWDKQAELISKYIKKGEQICIRGYLTLRSWTDNNGNKRTTAEVIADEISFVSSANQNAQNPSMPPNPSSFQNSAYTPSAYTSQPQFEEIPNDGDLPF